ncbi:exported hypothetical protein [Nitrospina gracilis 3/211]|uniref:Uncharacterized protein n=1 Tax=Nitrospina gracilis (strain 3/211) TaxID=1266370 RepID=M1YMR5_NITG3|nr:MULTISPECIES: hypothetical protein [Nitrospina]MCF8724572.1 hypothetical protein [Nitrospina sp. Nb-3]CCQ91750.1 exported hypothetical protein [Nitrospina gracilis 3/211]
MKNIIPVLTTALLIWAIPFFAISHEGEHESNDDHIMESKHNLFEEGSGSSVLSQPGHGYGHEYKEGSPNATMKSGQIDEGSGGMKDHKPTPHRTGHEEGSGMKSMEHQTPSKAIPHAH